MYKSTGSVDLTVYPPAPNVIKGRFDPTKNNPNVCDPPFDSSYSVPLPQDSCIKAGACWQGAGDWKSTADATNYFPRHGARRRQAWLQSITTRYELYLAELQMANEDRDELCDEGQAGDRDDSREQDAGLLPDREQEREPARAPRPAGARSTSPSPIAIRRRSPAIRPSR